MKQLWTWFSIGFLVLLIASGKLDGASAQSTVERKCGYDVSWSIDLFTLLRFQSSSIHFIQFKRVARCQNQTCWMFTLWHIRTMTLAGWKLSISITMARNKFTKRQTFNWFWTRWLLRCSKIQLNDSFTLNHHSFSNGGKINQEIINRKSSNWFKKDDWSSLVALGVWMMKPRPIIKAQWINLLGDYGKSNIFQFIWKRSLI